MSEVTKEQLYNFVKADDDSGQSVYDIWKELGNEGTAQDFLNSLKGEHGKSAYESWLEIEGNVGKSEEEFLNEISKIYGPGGDELGLVKNGGNVIINQDGTMTAPEGSGTVDLPISKGTGEDSLVIGDGDAKGKNSVAGGSNDSDEIDKVKKMAQLAGYTVDTDNPTAYGDGSLALGVGAKTHSMGSLAIGISNSAGAKGFYWHSIDWSGEKPVIQLSTEQKPYRYYSILGQKIEQNSTATWNTEAASLLKSWVIGDKLTIVNNNKYGEGAIINDIDSTKGKITIDSLPFTQADVKVEFSSLSDITKLVLLYDDFSIYNPSKPNIGITEFSYGALSLGLKTNAAGAFSTSLGYNTKVISDFGHSEGRDNIAGYAAHAEGHECQALGNSSHSEGRFTHALGTNAHTEGYNTIANGYQSHAEGRETYANGNASHSEGYDTYANAENSHAEGVGTHAEGSHSHAEGNEAYTKGSASHAEGHQTSSFGTNSHAEGSKTHALGNNSHSEGYSKNNLHILSLNSVGENGLDRRYSSEDIPNLSNEDIKTIWDKYKISCSKGENSHVEGSNGLAFGTNSHAEGLECRATGSNSHVEGNASQSIGINSHAEGSNTKAEGNNSHTEGRRTRTIGTDAHAEGLETYAEGNSSHAEGYNTHANGENSHAEGLGTNASGSHSHAEGNASRAEGGSSHAEGHSSSSIGINSHAEGSNTIAEGNNSHTEGRRTHTIGTDAHAEGLETIAIGNASHAEGNNTTSIGINSHIEGGSSYLSESITVGGRDALIALSNEEIISRWNTYRYSLAKGDNSHAEGKNCLALGNVSHVEGDETQAIGLHSHAEGYRTIASGNQQHVQGKYNIEDTEDNYAHIIGNGTDNKKRSNIHTVDWEGNAWYKGSITSNGADYAEFFEWEDGNPNNEDRVGLLVTLNGEKIKFANSGDEILGIISGTAAILGDNYECSWKGRYLTDRFGRIIYEDVEEFVEEVIGEDEQGNPIIENNSLGISKQPKLNPDFDASREYIRRSDRPEWGTVGMIGKLYVRDDGTCQVNGYATVGENGVATASTEKTNMRVLSRVDESTIRVLLK